MILKLKEIPGIYAALRALDGVEKLVRVEGQPDRVIREPFFFGGKVRWNIAKNLGILKRAIEAYDEARNNLLKSLTKDDVGIPAEDKVAIATFNRENEKLLNVEDDLPGILKFTEEDLATDKNPIPPSALMELLTLISVPAPATTP